MTTGGGCRSRGDYDNDADNNNGAGQGGSIVLLGRAVDAAAAIGAG